MPVTLIGESVFARCLSSLKKERIKASKLLKGPEHTTSDVGDVNKFIEDIKHALYASKIISYAQGFMLLRQAAKVLAKIIISFKLTIDSILFNFSLFQKLPIVSFLGI